MSHHEDGHEQDSHEHGDHEEHAQPSEQDVTGGYGDDGEAEALLGEQGGSAAAADPAEVDADAQAEGAEAPHDPNAQ